MATIDKRSGKKGTTYRVRVRLYGGDSETRTFTSLTLARQFAAQAEKEVQEGRFVEQSEARKHTVTDAIERYKTEIKFKNSKNKLIKESQLNWWKNLVGSILISNLTPQLLSEIKSNFLKTHTGATWNRYKSALSSVLSLCAGEWGWCFINPASKIKAEKESPGVVRYLDEEERRRLLTVAKNYPLHAMYPFILLALSTGMRKGEIKRLKWSDIDFENASVLVEITKNGSPRRLPIPPFCYQALKEYSKIRKINSPLIFPSAVESKPTIPLRIESYWRDIKTKAELKNFRFHDLRHTFASYLAMNGASALEISELLGHRDMQMVKRYAHLTSKHNAELLNRLDKKLFYG